MTARCYLCHRVLPITEFGRDASKASGRASRCRPCDSARSLARYEDLDADARNRRRALARVADRRRRERNARVASLPEAERPRQPKRRSRKKSPNASDSQIAVSPAKEVPK